MDGLAPETTLGLSLSAWRVARRSLGWRVPVAAILPAEPGRAAARMDRRGVERSRAREYWRVQAVRAGGSRVS